MAAKSAEYFRVRRSLGNGRVGGRRLAELALLRQRILGRDRSGISCLSDSNYDWGQGVPDLERWREAHAGRPLDVSYFGTDPLLDRLPIRHLKLHTLPIDRPEEVLAQVQGHYLAVGTTLLYGS